MTHEGLEETMASPESTAERATLLVAMEEDAFRASSFGRPEQKKWVDGFSAVSRMLAMAATLPPSDEATESAPNGAV